MNEIIQKLDLYFGKKAPQLPKEAKEWIVKFSPYLAIIGLIFALMAVASVMRINSAARLWYGYYGIRQESMITLPTIIYIFSLVLYAISIPGLFKRNTSGWNFSMYAVILNAIATFEPISIIISLVIGLYILFQVRPYYFGLATISEAISTPMKTQTKETNEPEQIKKDNQATSVNQENK